MSFENRCAAGAVICCIASAIEKVGLSQGKQACDFVSRFYIGLLMGVRCRNYIPR